MKKYFVILLVAIVMLSSQIACGGDEYNGQMGDLLGVAGTLDGLTK
jgi:hypothetical protein